MTERYYYNGSFINDRQENDCLSSIEVADRLNQYERRIEGAVLKLNKLKDENKQLKKEIEDLKWNLELEK